MTIFLNGKETEVDESFTILDLVKQVKLPPELVACELNLKIIKRSDYSSVKISAGDRIEILQMIGGG